MEETTLPIIADSTKKENQDYYQYRVQCLKTISCLLDATLGVLISDSSGDWASTVESYQEAASLMPELNEPSGRDANGSL